MKYCIHLILIFSFLCSGCSNENHKLGYESDEVVSEERILQKSSAQEDLPSEYGNSNQNSSLTQEYTTNTFSINYPYDWEIVQQNNKVTNNTTVAVQIMRQELNEYDFRPNVNVIISGRKNKERTSTLAYISYNQVKETGFAESLVNIDSCSVGGCDGSVVEYIANVEGYKLHIYQYIVKKLDNTTIIITMTLDHSKLNNQKDVAQKIINSIKIY